MPKVSVLIPTYNRARFIKRAIDSVLNQTYRDVEIVVVDDGSTDNTQKIIESYGDQVTYIYQENKGAASARNAGIDASVGEYISFLDSDDYYAKNNLKIKVAILESNSGISWVYSDWQYVDQKGEKLINGSDRFNYSNKKLSGALFKELLYKRNFITTGVVMVRRLVLEDVGCFDPTILSQEEYDLWLRISVKYPVHYVDENLVTVTDHFDSLSKDFSKWVYGNVLIIDKIEKILPNDLYVEKSFINRLHADKYTFLGRDFMQKGQYKNAMTSFWKSIKRLPLQKRIYWLVALLIVNSFKEYINFFSKTNSKNKYN